MLIYLFILKVPYQMILFHHQSPNGRSQDALRKEQGTLEEWQTFKLG